MSLSVRTSNVLRSALADKRSANEILNIIVPFAGTKASFKGMINVEGGGTASLVIEANAVGVASNTSITGDGLTDISTLAGANYTALESGAVILKDLDVVSISGGADAIAAGGSLSARTKKLIEIAFCDKTAKNAFIAAVENNTALDARSKRILRIVLADKRAYDEIVAVL